ncbi:ATP-binding cassette domain-containing protein [Entomomonas sp. E2T0]|uniref:phosphatase domain-containing putative toxin n=1 Tax=Entomomonas sp. E2T0 TaxID=2930213 RepID=UPI0022280E4D|nr:ATP-binding cassette domain-containing protein [Entomomonas sp. E2T0]UYZ85156.1 ATP-binding cassette domain-containing protein [Entomomonas sp. E2T0]
MLLDVKSYGIAFGTRVILADVSFSIQSDKGVIVVMGPGGTGKSTLMRSLAGINKRSSNAHEWGQILYKDQPIDQQNVPQLVQQNAKAMGLPVIESFAEKIRQSSEKSLSPAEMRAYIVSELERLEIPSMIQYLDQPMIQLPVEHARAVNMLREAFSKEPILLLDEPTTGMTEVGASMLLKLTKKLGEERVCMIILHNQMQAKEVGDQILLLAGGRVQAYETKDDFFNNKSKNDVVAQFLRSGSCNIPAPDADVNTLDESIPKPPPLPEEAIKIIEALKAAAPKPQTVIPKANNDLVMPKEEVKTPSSSVVEQPNKEPQLSSSEMTESTPIASVTTNLAVKNASRSKFRGPNGFHWIAPDQLAGCPMPGIVAPLEYDLSALRDVGVTVLVNLTDRELPEEILAQYGIRSVQFKIEDRRAPPVMWIKMLLVQLDKLLANGDVLAVHCLAGLGRTGTVLGAWLIKKGLTAEETLKRLRQIDAGYVQSKEQEDLLYALEENILIRAT